MEFSRIYVELEQVKMRIMFPMGDCRSRVVENYILHASQIKIVFTYA